MKNAMKKTADKLKRFLVISSLLIGGCGLISGAFAWGAIRGGDILSIQITYAPAEQPLREDQLAALQLYGEVQGTKGRK